MRQSSSPSFRTMHSLRVKGSATIDTLADMTRADPSIVRRYLDELCAVACAECNGTGTTWQLTEQGRAVHAQLLAAVVTAARPNPEFDTWTARFLVIDGRFGELSAAWSVWDGRPNDHSSAEYDAAVIENLSHLHVSAEPAIRAFGTVFEHMDAYGPRLESVLVRILDGESNMFTDVTCGSYHEVWTELRDDLILTVDAARSVGERS